MEGDHQEVQSSNVVDVKADVRMNSNVVMQTQQLQGWQTGLFDCFEDDCESFCLSAWLPCFTFTCIADIVDKGSDCGCLYLVIYLTAVQVGLHWMYAGWYRGKLRAEYGLPDAPLPDCLTHLFCHWCALAQEYRELAARGFNVSDGWDGRPQVPAAAAAARIPPGVQMPMKR